MKFLALLLLFSSYLFAQVGSSLTFSEIMFYTTSSENSEFVEIYNTSTTTTVDLSNIKIYYNGGNKPFTEYNGGGYSLGPEKFAVIFENDLDVATGVYAGKIPADALILVRTSSSWGMHNTANKEMLLKNTNGDTLDVYTYSASNSRSYSDEKINLTKDNTASNWGNSSSKYGSPGGINTITPLQYDLEINQFTGTPSVLFDGNSIKLSTVIKNIATDTAANYTLTLYEDSNNNSQPDAGEELTTQNYTNLASGESITNQFNRNSLQEGDYRFWAILNYNQDQKNSNDTSVLNISVYEPQRNYLDISINEIMYDPISGEPEWVELKNNSSDNINLLDWTISDASSTVSISNSNLIVNAGEYLVIIDNSGVNNKYNITSSKITIALPSLNNSGDEIILKDPASKTIDSLKYLTSWGNADEVSLERISSGASSNSSSNWGISKASNAATPGNINSLSPKQHDLELTDISISPTYVIDGSDATITAKTKNLGAQAAAAYTIDIYYDSNNNQTGEVGEKIFSQNYINLASGDSVLSQVTMNSLAIDSYNIIATATYASDQYNDNNSKQKSFNVIPTPAAFNDIVVSEIMYSPFSGNAEWVELFNKSSNAINLKKWKISDASSSINISDTSLTLNPNEYIVISDNQSVSTNFTVPSKVVVVNIPSLNNGGDDVKIIDSLSRTIDSVAYLSSWGGETGKSLERKRDAIASNLTSNWGTSTDAAGGTPGKDNSIKTYQLDIAISDFKLSPDKIYSIDNASTSLKLFNNGYDQATAFTLKLFEDKNNNNIGEVGEEIATKSYSSFSIGQAKNVYFPLGNLTVGTHYFIAEVSYNNDMKLSNNALRDTAVVSYASTYFNDIVINEIMYDPISGGVEWIELYNRTQKEIDLRYYKLGNPEVKFDISKSSLKIPANGYLVLSSSSNLGGTLTPQSDIVIVPLFTLSNSNGEIAFYDNNEREIDDVAYNSSMGGSDGISLERKSSSSSSYMISNWGSSTDKSGGTPGYINSATPLQNDVEIVNVRIESDSTVALCDINIISTISNKFNQPITNTNYKIFIDLNSNGIAETSEEIYSKVIDNIEGSTSIEASDKLTGLSAGNYSFITLVENSLDTRSSNDTASVNFVVNSRPANYNQVIISELMYAPPSGSPEWVELYNNSLDSIEIFGWTISDGSSTTLIPQFTIGANEFLLLSSYPAQLMITNASNGNNNIVYLDLPSLNNSGDDVIIKDSYGNVIDSLKYNPAWGGNDGHSLERKILNGNSFDSNNWGSSKYIGGSGGTKNSITPAQFDLALSNSEVMQSSKFEFNPFTLKTTVKNVGQQSVPNFSISYNLLKEEGKIEIATKNFSQSLLPKDSIIITQEFNDFAFGTYNLEIYTIYDFDTVYSNNKDTVNIEILKTPEAPHDILITEFMYNPLEDESEWIEIYNNSDTEINISGWEISDNTTTKTISDSITIPSYEYYVLAQNEMFLQKYPLVSNVSIFSFSSLNNSGDKIIIGNQYGTTIDSLEYLGDWGSAGISIEKKDIGNFSNSGENWLANTFINHSSPGKNNYNELKNSDLGIESFTVENENVYLGQKIGLNITVRNFGTKQSSLFGFELFNDKNFDKIPQPSERIYLNNFEGLAPNNEKNIKYNYSLLKSGSLNIIARINYYEDEKTWNNIEAVSLDILPLPYNYNDIVINEIMYAPISGKSEWIEIYNRSGKEINLKDWEVFDAVSSSKIETDFKIAPNSFGVISKSSDISNDYEINSPLLVMNLPSLNNDKDLIGIKDYSGTPIDSLTYYAQWNNKNNGSSLERISIDNTSNEKSNWHESYSQLLGTPGKSNSSPPQKTDIELVNVIFESDSIKNIDTLIATIKIKNNGNLDASNIKLINRIIGDSLSINDTLSISTVGAKDSIIVTKKYNSLYAGKYDFISTVTYSEDDDLSNNSFTKTFIVSNIEAPKFADLELTSLSLGSDELYPSDSIFVKGSIKNLSKEISNNVKVVFSLISNNGVQVDTTEIKNISGNDSVFVSKKYPPQIAGDYSITLLITAANDNIQSNNSKSISFNVKQYEYDYSALKINEIMFAPIAGEPEWIELKNISNYSIDLKGIKVRDASSNSVIIENSYIIKSNDFVVLSKDSTVVNYYNNKFNYLTINLPTLNNSGDELVLVSPNDEVLDSVAYASSWLIEDGKSIERIATSKPAEDKENWLTSHAKEGATPGDENSATVGWIDWELVQFSSPNAETILPDSTELNITIKNIGINKSESAKLIVFDDINNDSTFQKNELIREYQIEKNNNNEELSYKFFVELSEPGKHLIIASVVDSLDINPTNNIKLLEYKIIKPQFTFGDVLVNEIMYNPESGFPEWIELYNNSSSPLNLKGVSISDASSTSKGIDGDNWINSKEYFVIASDTTIIKQYSIESGIAFVKLPSLNNSGDRIVVKDSLGIIIDSLSYTNDWGGEKGISLEKFSPELSSSNMENWGSANTLTKATPGKINSVTSGWVDISIDEVSPNSNSIVYPNTLQLVMILSNKGYKDAKNVSLKFFVDKNNNGIGEIEEILDSSIVDILTAKGAIQIEKEITNLQVGDNSILIEAYHSEDRIIENNFYKFNVKYIKAIENRNDIIISEFMASPAAGESEWIELFNRSNKEINLFDYSISDSRNKVMLPNRGVILNLMNTLWLQMTLQY